MSLFSLGKNIVKTPLRFLKDLYVRGGNVYTPVVIYQMGKVGSTSICNSLSDCGVSLVDQVHRIEPEHVDELVASRAARGLQPHSPDHCNRGLQLYKQIIAPKRRAKFISLARNPIDRNVSAFFFNIFDRKSLLRSLSIPELIEEFLERYSHDVPLTWFQKEPAVTVDIDVYDTPFPAERGYKTYQSGPFDLLVLRTEMPDPRKEELIQKFLGLTHFQIQRQNAGAEKGYAETYRSFKENAQLPKSYLDRMLQSQYAQHFYTDREIEQTYHRWS